jgi:hypothetical protein
VKACVDMGCVDDMEGCDGEGEGGCFDAAADNNLGFFGKAFVCLVFFRELGGKDFLEDGCFCVVCLDGVAGERAGNVGGLVLWYMSIQIVMGKDEKFYLRV